MNDLERARLMYTVLDGEATDAEARELDRVLAAEPAARTEFGQIRRLFEGINRVPKAFPPEGLVAAVMANIPQNSPPQGPLDQLSLQSRAIGLAWMKARAKARGNRQRTSGSSAGDLSQGVENERAEQQSFA